MSELNTAYLFYVDGKYAEALHAFEAIVAGYPNNFAGRRALVFVERTLDKLGRSNEILATLNSAWASYSGKALGEFAKARRVYQYINQGRYQDAVTQAVEIVRLNDDTTLVKFALYDLGSIYWYYLGDTKTGEQYYRQLIARFPKDHLTNSALATLGEWVPEKPAGRASPTLSAGDSRGLLTGYSVSQNYPNPFNPSTVITYQLPTAGYVTMKVYNTLGQEVATLVDAFQDAGIKSVAFDAAPLPSGVYFYRLQSGTFIQNKKMLLVK
jgi:tetratricopeptide (TPR) repeat protein